jgi:hypothetical protein
VAGRYRIAVPRPPFGVLGEMMRNTWTKMDYPRRALGLVFAAVLALGLGAGTVLAAAPQPLVPQPAAEDFAHRMAD